MRVPGISGRKVLRMNMGIDRLTAEVAGIRAREAAVRARLAVKQRELDRATAQLDVARGRLERVRLHLRRALTALRERGTGVVTATIDLDRVRRVRAGLPCLEHVRPLLYRRPPSRTSAR